MVYHHKKPGVTFWSTVVVVVVLVFLAYPLSSGPVFWLLNHKELPAPLVTALVILYLPVTWLINSSWSVKNDEFTWLGMAMQWYLAFWA
jgi:hypothetical protein